MRKIGNMAKMFNLSQAEQVFKKLKTLGYDCADYQNMSNTEEEQFKLSNSEFEKNLLTYKKAAENNGIEIYQAHGPWRFPPQDATEKDRAERFEKMKKSIWGTAILGARCFVIHPIMPYGYDKNPEPERFMELNLEFFSRLAPIAKENGVIMCLENMPMPALTLASPLQILEFTKKLNSDAVGVCLDTGHCSVLGVSPADAIRMLGDNLKCLHVHDNDGAHDLHQAPYYGVIDWADFKLALKSAPADVPCILETDVSGKLPAEIKEYHEIALAKTARYLAE